ncbi:hypothetical protein DP939_19540 [Spongiactinospora rosea]|uniref:Uncharacterized protein n=1 Tax=Spongiactinospora rosea TaxID=2248750 RepID=A0A366LXJ8_9ACTN|nr:hypothetical protein [Spongiactinospora rosea]RBQ18675.1 hypothetical protein DP939_19540 [Spongiactinospora rosea]
MKIRSLSAAALLAAALGTAALTGAAPAAALAGDPEPLPGFQRGPFATLAQCQVERDRIALQLGSHAWVTQCWHEARGYFYKGVYID